MRLPRLSEENEKPKVEVLPLVDVIFIVLISFVYAMIHMDVVSSIDVHLPVLKEVEEKDLKKPIIVALNDENQAFLNDKPLPVDELVKQLKQQLNNEGKDQAVIIEGDQKADLGEALKLLNEFRKNDITKISFRTKKEK